MNTIFYECYFCRFFAKLAANNANLLRMSSWWSCTEGFMCFSKKTKQNHNNAVCLIIGDDFFTSFFCCLIL